MPCSQTYVDQDDPTCCYMPSLPSHKFPTLVRWFDNDTIVISGDQSQQEIEDLLTACIGIEGHLPSKLILENIDKHDNDSLKALTVKLHHFTHLEELKIAKKIKRIGLELLCSHFDSIQNLKVLDLDKCVIKTEGMIVLSNALHKVPNLTTLNLAHNKIEDEGVIALCSQLHVIPHLNVLNLSFNHIASQGMITLSHNLMYMQELRILNLQNNDVCDVFHGGHTVHAVETFSAQLHLARNLQVLNLGVNSIQNALVAMTINKGSKLPLLSLSLWGNYIEERLANVPDCMDAIGKLLDCMPNLQYLDLKHNHFGDQGVSLLASHLHKIPKLTHLNLGSTWSGSKGLMSLIRHLDHIPKLEVFVYFGNGKKITDSEILDEMEARNIKFVHGLGRED